MTVKRIELFAALQFLWELVRFLGLFALVLLRFQRIFLEEPGAVLWLVALGSGQLLAPALLALFLYNPAGRAALLPFLRLAKMLQVFPALLLAVFLAYRQAHALLPFLPSRFALSASVAVASLLDLYLLYLLFTIRAGTLGAAPQPAGPSVQKP
jgi:hypothetical protein